MCFLCLFSREARADEFVVAAYTGPNHTQQSVLILHHPPTETDLLLHDAKWEGRPFDRPLYWGLRAAYFFGKVGSWEFAPEFEFVHLKVFLKTQDRSRATGILRGNQIQEDVRVGDIIERFNISHGLNLCLFNFVIRRVLFANPEKPQGRLLLGGRLGVGFNISHFESTIPPSGHHEGYEFGGDVYHLAVGIEVPVFKGIGLFTEYKYTTTAPRGEISGGQAKVELDTHHLVAGLAFHW